MRINCYNINRITDKYHYFYDVAAGTGMCSIVHLRSEYFQGKSSACLCLHPALTNWHLSITEVVFGNDFWGT